MSFHRGNRSNGRFTVFVRALLKFRARDVISKLISYCLINKCVRGTSKLAYHGSHDRLLIRNRLFRLLMYTKLVTLHANLLYRR